MGLWLYNLDIYIFGHYDKPGPCWIPTDPFQWVQCKFQHRLSYPLPQSHCPRPRPPYSWPLYDPLRSRSAWRGSLGFAFYQIVVPWSACWRCVWHSDCLLHLKGRPIELSGFLLKLPAISNLTIRQKIKLRNEQISNDFHYNDCQTT